MVVGNGLVKVVTKEVHDRHTYVFTLESDVFLLIFRREITLQQAFFKGKMDIKGDILLALKMNARIN